MANHEIVPASAFTKGTAERRKSATSFSLPGFACSGTYRANFVITFSSFDVSESILKQLQVRYTAVALDEPQGRSNQGNTDKVVSSLMIRLRARGRHNKARNTTTAVARFRK